MTGLRPLRHTSSDDFELGLLCSIDGDEPSPSALSSAAVALGLAASITTATAGAGAAGIATATSASSGAIWLSVVKALAIGTLSGFVVSAGTGVLLSAPSVPSSTSAVASSAPSAMPHDRARMDPIRQNEHEMQLRDDVGVVVTRPKAPLQQVASPVRSARSTSLEPRVAVGPRGMAPSARTPVERIPATSDGPPVPTPGASGVIAMEWQQPSSASQGVSIAEEVRIVDGARRLLALGRAREALSELERYRQRWPNGVLSTETLVLRVEALLKLGDRASALREAKPLIDAYPKSRHAARLSTLLGLSTSE